MISLLRRGDPFEIFGLPDLHVAVLRLDPFIPFDERIASIPRELIDQRDCSGRSALSWAAERGDLDQIQRLLVRGADPNKVDFRGGTPLIHCIHDVHCLTVLLEAGSHVNHVDYSGNTKFNYLVARGDDVDCLETLWRFGLDLNFHAKSSTPIIFSALERDRPRTVRWMLEHGINLKVCNVVGERPLLHFLSITEDSFPNILEMLLKTLDCLPTNKLREGILHYIARSASFKYMQIFEEQVFLSDLDPEQRSLCGFKLWEHNDPGVTPTELAVWRRDHQQEWSRECATPLDPDPVAWFKAFETFIGSINAARDARMREGIMETATTIPNDQADSDKILSSDHGMHPKLPGTYPQE